MNTAELKLDLFRKIDNLPEEVLIEVQKMLINILLQKREVKSKRNFGCLKGIVVYMADDFDAPLEDFKEYSK